MVERQRLTEEEANEKLLIGCENADLSMVEDALMQGAKHDAVTTSHESALHLAVQSGNEEIVSFLLNHTRISPDVQDAYGRTPLHWASQQGSLRIVEALLLSRADIDAKDLMGVQPQIYAEMAGFPEIVKLYKVVRQNRK